MNQLSKTKKKKSWLPWPIKILLLLVAAAAAYVIINQGTATNTNSKTFVLRRGTLPITVSSSGSVKSLAPTHIRAEIRERGVKIISIVDEGRRITKEDIDNKLVLVELDSSGMEDNIMRDELDYEGAVAELSKAEQDIEILRKENESDIQAAQRDVKFKAMDFRKYIGEALANEVIARVERQHAAGKALETLQKTAAAYHRADADARGLLERALIARDNEGGDSTLGTETTDVEANTETEDAADTNKRALAMIASSAGALLGGDMDLGASGAASFERYGFETDTRSAQELENEATAKRLEAATLKSTLEEQTKTFLASAENAGLIPSQFTGDPRQWVIQFDPIDFAALAKDPRLGGAAAQEREKLRTDIMLDQEEILMAKKSLEGSQELFKNEFIPEIELEKERLAYERKSRTLALKQENERLFFNYEFPKLAEQAYADYEEALHLLERTKTITFTKLTSAEVELTSARKRLTYHEAEIRENEDLIQNYKIYAETEGLVVYGDPGGSSRYYNNDVIQEGAEVREGMTLLTIPDITQMAVEVNIHEAAIKKISTGLKARVFVEAFPEEDVTGEVVKVAVLPSSSSRYMNPDLKLYETTIDIDGIHEWLKPGMTAQVEIYVDLLEDVLYVPLQAMTTFGGERVVYLANGERRAVETGQYSENYIEITSGLEADDEVLLDLRPFKGSVEETPGDAPENTAPAQESQNAKQENPKKNQPKAKELPMNESS